jgi:hypothetical protein
MSNESTRSQPQRAIRLIFEYDGEHVRLVTQQTVDMVVAETYPPGAAAPGYYVDVRDARDSTLARAAAHGAFVGSKEVFPEHDDDRITRMDVQQQRGAFTVTLPATEEAHHVTVVKIETGVESVAARDRAEALAVDIASFPLGESAR